MVALFTSALRDFLKRRDGAPGRRGTTDSEREGVA
jgi:hypothetical protein